MKSGGSTATIAIVRSRLLRESQFVAAGAAAGVLIAYVQRFDDAPAHFAAAIALAALCGIAAAFSARSKRNRELALCEASAPLYAREIARARTASVCATLVIALTAYWCLSAAYGEFSIGNAAASIACGCAAAALALCAAGATNNLRAAYLLIAAAIAAATFFLWNAAALLCCAAVFYAALRQYGELLAREPL